MTSVYSINVMIIGTAYIKAGSEAEAIATAARYVRDEPGLEVEDDEQMVSGRRYDDPDLPEFSLSPAMTLTSLWPGDVDEVQTLVDEPERPKVTYVCATCGSENVKSDAYAEWDVDRQCWDVIDTFDKGAVCEDCDGDCRIKERPVEQEAI